MQTVQIVEHLLDAGGTDIPTLVVELEESNHRNGIKRFEHQIQVRDECRFGVSEQGNSDDCDDAERSGSKEMHFEVICGGGGAKLD